MKIDYANYTLSKKEKIRFLVAGYMILYAVIYLFYHSIIFSFAGAAAVYLTIPFAEKYLAEKRKSSLTIQFKDLLYSLSTSIATGRQVPEALAEASENLSLIYGEDGPMVVELRYMNKRIHEHRESDIDLLLDFARRSHCEDISSFVQVYYTCRALGGNLEKVLKSTTEILLEKMNIEREIRMLTAQKKLEGRIISTMPLIVILFLNVFSPDYLAPLYTTIAGKMIMSLSLIGIGYAYRLMNRITDIEI